MTVAISPSQRDNIIDSAIAAEGFEYIGCERVHDCGSDALCVYIDNQPEGITANVCGKISELLIVLLPAEGILGENESLQVSSPGLARPLFKLSHYEPYVGKQIKVKLTVPQEGRRKFKGLLLAVCEAAIKIEVDGKEEIIEVADIDKANVCLPDRLSEL